LIYWKKEAFMQKGTCRMPKKQKKFLSILFLSGLLMLLVACGKSGNSPIVAIANESEYEEVVAQDVAYLYFGFDDCPYCKEFRPILEEELTETGRPPVITYEKASMMPTTTKCWIPRRRIRPRPDQTGGAAVGSSI
jgi:hypothetical protein